MASVQDIQKTIAEQYNQQATRDTGTDLDKDAFLQLLVTEMRYQDPLNPTSDKEFLAQMAQFSSLEQMQNLNSSFQMQQSLSMIGKYVTASTLSSSEGDANYVSGIVEGVSLISGSTYLQIGDDYISLEDVEDIRNEAPEEVEDDTETEETGESDSED